MKQLKTKYKISINHGPYSRNPVQLSTLSLRGLNGLPDKGSIIIAMWMMKKQEHF